MDLADHFGLSFKDARKKFDAGDTSPDVLKTIAQYEEEDIRIVGVRIFRGDEHWLALSIAIAHLRVRQEALVVIGPQQIVDG